MRILLLGATGRTGNLVLKEAIKQGFFVNCLIRDSSKLKQKHQNLTIFQGSTLIEKELQLAMKNCDAVISVLNISRQNDFPWARLKTPKDFLSNTMQKVIPLAEKNELKRVVVCSAWGVRRSANDIPFWFKFIINNSNIRFAYQDHARQENIIQSSKLDWTIVQPTGLTNSTKEKPLIESFNNSPKPKLTISRLQVAQYLVHSLNRPELIKRIPVISTPF